MTVARKPRRAQVDGGSTARAPEPLLCGREGAPSIVPFPQRPAKGAWAFPGKPRRIHPGAAFLDCMVGSGYDSGTASAVPFGLAVFYSATLSVGWRAAGSARRHGQHPTQIRRVICSTRRDRRGAHRVMCGARHAVLQTVHARFAARVVALVRASGRTEPAGASDLGAVL